MRAARVDANHGSIVKALRRVGCLVVDTSRVGHGFPDLVCSMRRRVFLIEVKTARGKRTEDQVYFEAQGWPVALVRTVDEALAVVNR